MSDLPLLQLLALLIAGIVAWIGYQQFQLAQEKLKLDLFEKRFAVFSATRALLRLGLKIDSDAVFKFRQNTQDAIFLFDQRVVDYLAMLEEKALNALTARSIASGPHTSEEGRRRELEKESGLIKELIAESPKLKDVFAPHLKFQLWKPPAGRKIVLAAIAIIGIISGFLEKFFAPSHLLIEGSYNLPAIGWLAFILTAVGTIGYILDDLCNSRGGR